MRRVIPTLDSVITAPAAEPLTLALVKAQRRVSSSVTALDDLFTLWIAAARQHFEEVTGRQTITATRELWMETFPLEREIELPYPPLQSVVSIKYDDTTDTEQTFSTSNYRTIAPAGDYCARGRVVLQDGSYWPIPATNRPWPVRIQFTCGYADDNTGVPALIQSLLMMIIGTFHKYGEDVQAQRGTMERVPLGAKLLMDGFKYSALPLLRPTTVGLIPGTGRWPG